MASHRVPGPACQHSRPVNVNDGTSCRMPSPTPGPLGLSYDLVSSWRPDEKLVAAARRVIPKLPAEMRSQFASLFSGENLAITGGVLAAWGASHLIGVGEIVDVVLAGAGTVTLGWQVGQAGWDIGSFVSLAVNANSTADLEAAAHHLSRAVLAIGVTAFVLLIMKCGGKLRAGVVADARSGTGFYTLYPRGPGAAAGPLPSSCSMVSRWVSVEEARLWMEEGATRIHPRIGTEVSNFDVRVYVTVPGAPNPTTNPIRVDFAIPKAALQKAGRDDWRQLASRGETGACPLPRVCVVVLEV
jgi:hypothetical protein